MRTLKLFSILLLSMLFVNMVSAVPPFQSTTVALNGLEIEATNSNYLEQNITHTFHFRVYNASTGVYISPDDVTCSMAIINNEGNYIIQIPDATNTGYRFDVEVLGGNFTETGIYHKGINCLLDDGTQGGVLTQSFQITTTGEDPPEGIVILGFIIILLLIFSSAIVVIIKSVGLMIEANLDILDIAYNWGLFFGLLGVSMFAGIYLGNVTINNFLDILITIMAFPMVVVPVLGFFLSMFRQKKAKKKKEAQW